MKLRLRLFVRLLAGLLACGGGAKAQVTITSAIPSVCTGSTISVSYSSGYTEPFDILNLYVYLYRSTSDSVLIAQTGDARVIRNSTRIDAPIPSDQPAGGYTIKLKLTRKPTVGNVITYISPPSNVFTISDIPKLPSVTNLSACLNTTPPLITTAVTASSGMLNWYTSSVTSTTVAPVLSTTATDTTSYSVSQSVNGCESPRNTFTYTVNGLPNAPSVNYAPLFYCQGITANPFPAASSNGNPLTWYTDPAGNTPLLNLTPQTTDVKATPYYVRQTNSDGCRSSLSSLTIVVSSRPASPSVTNQPLVHCQGLSSVTLSATATGTLTWYNQSGASIPPAVSITNPGTTTYYVSQTDGNTCESDRASITVTVNPKPAPPKVKDISACLNTTPPSIITAVTDFGGSLKWYSPASMSLTAAPVLSSSAVVTTSYFVTQTQNSCESAQATIMYTVKSLPQAPGVVQNPLILCQSSVADPLVATGTGTLKWYDPGNNEYASIRPGTDIVGPTVYRVTQTVDGCESLPTSLTVVVIAKPNKPAVFSPAPYCQLSPAVSLSLSATGQHLKWYTTLTGRPASFSTDAPTPLTDKAGLFTYYVTQTDNNTCESDPARIDVQVNPKPKPPGTEAISFCINNATALTATPDPGGKLNWYGTDPTNKNPTLTAPVPTTAITGTPVNYYVSQIVNGCESDKASLAVTINALPTAPRVNFSPIYYCLGATALPLSATASTDGNLVWYDSPTTTTPLSGTPTPSTASIIPPTTNYYVSQQVNGCEGLRASIAVTINPLPGRPTVVASQTYCQGLSSAPLSATATGTNALAWYDQNGATISPAASTTRPGPTTYYVSQTDGNQCISERAAITVNITATPQPPASATVALCLSSPPTALTATAPDSGRLNWYDEKGTALPAAPTPSTSALGPQIYYVSQSVGLCEGQRATITVIVKPLPTKPTVVSPLSFCQNSPPPSLSATATGTLYWYDLTGIRSRQEPVVSTSAVVTNTYFVTQEVDGCESDKNTLVVIIKALPQAPAVSASTIGRCQNTGSVSLSATGASTGTLYWYLPNGTSTTATPVVSTSTTGSFSYSVSQRVEGCESEKTSITVVITATPDAPTTAPVSFCLNGPAAPLSATATGTLNWYKADGTALGTSAPSPPTSATGTTTYLVSQSINGCESTKAPLAVTIKPLPTAPTVSSVSLCQNTQPTALSATGTGALNWYAPDGTALPSAPFPPLSTVGTLAPYSVSQTVNGCEGQKALITVTVKPQPAQPSVSNSLVIICQNTTTSVPLTATAGSGGTLNWYGTNPGGSSSPNPSVPVATAAGTFTYYVSQTVNGCESLQAPIAVFVQATPDKPLIGDNPLYCQGGTTTTLSATASAGGTLNWYTPDRVGSPLPAPPSPPVNAAGTVSYSVSQSINGCEGPRTGLTATIRAAPNPPNPITFTFCQNTPATSLSAVENGGRLKWYDSPTGGNVSTTAPTPNTTSTTPTFAYVSLTDVNGCESTRTTITVKINPQPSAPTTTPLSVCQGAVTLPSLALSVGATGTPNWYKDQTGGTSSPIAPVPPTNEPGLQQYFVSQKDAITGCESPRSTLVVTVTPKPGAPALSTIGSITACQGPTSIVLTAGGQNLKWYAEATSTTPVGQGDSFVRSALLLGPFEYYVSQTVSSCEGLRARVQGVVNAVPAAPGVTPSQSFCQDAQVQALTPNDASVQWYDQNDRLISPPTPDTRVDATKTTTYKVAQTVNGCTSIKATLTYTVNVVPPPAVNSSIDFCQNQMSKQLTPVGPSVTWYGPSGVVPAGQATTAGSYSVTQTAQGCESRKKEVVVTISPQATATLTGSTSISQGSSTTLTLTGTGSYTYALANETTGAVVATGTVVSTSPTGTSVQPVVVTPGATTTYRLQSVTNACGAGIANGSALVTVTIPTITTGALSTTSICAGSSLDVPFTYTGTFAPANTFTAEIALITDPTTASSYIPVDVTGVRGQSLSVRIPTAIKAGQYRLRVGASNATYPISGTASSTTLTVRSLPTATLSASTTTVTRVGGKSQPVELRVDLFGEKPWSLTYTATTTTSKSQSTITTEANPYRFTTTPDSTTTYRLLSVSSANGCGLGTVGVDSVRIAVQTVTAAELDPFSNTVKVYPVPTNGAVTIDIDVPLPQPAQLRLTNLDGQTTQQLTTRQRQTTLTLDREPGGTYLLYIKIGDKWTVRRILKW